MAAKNNEYFANLDSKETALIVLSKANLWFNNLDTNGYLDKLRGMWAAYHGAYYSDAGDGHKITFGGEQGELAHLPVNNFRNIAQHIMVMVTATRPTMEARAVNTDYKSLVQTKLANGLLDYYMREKRLEKYLKTAVEYAIVLGAGYIKMEWNALGGEIYDRIDPVTDDETGEVIEEGYPVYEGDVHFTNLSPFDVVFDSTKEGQDHDWVVTRSFKNRFDLVAKYPEFENEILKLSTKSEMLRYRFNSLGNDETDDVAIYEFFHNRTEAMPEGRYLLFIDGGTALMDAPMPYDTLPVYRISPSDILGTPYGYSPMFDLLPIQDALNSLYTMILSNQSAFGVQNIMIPRGADVSPATLVGGLNLIEYNHQIGKPEALNLTQTPKEIFEFIGMLERVQETLSGVNSVTRGNPESSLKSGNALALVQSMALQYMSGLQQSYVQLIEDVGTGLIKMLQRFASVPRIAMITGKSNRAYMREFTGEDLSSINRIIVDVGNPLARCLAKDTPVLMYDGSIQMVQDIVVGDQVMGPDSKPRTVSGVNTGNEMMYRIVSKDKNQKISYGVNESHILTLRYCSDDARYEAKKGQTLDISVRDYLKLNSRHKNILQGFKTPIEFSSKELPIPPYILGAWLGDGHSDAAALTTMDSEILSAWTDYANSIGMQIRVSTNDNCGQAKIYFITSGQQSGKPDRNVLINELRSLEVWKNKHIPRYYLTSSRSDRLQLLAGLLDTDGYLIDGTFVFTQKSERLSSDVIYLAQSLGFRVTHKTVKSSSSDLVGVVTGEVNKITIGGNTWEIPTKLQRKQAQSKEKSRNWLNYGIRVETVGEGEYFGFTLAEEPHFVLGDFTVTHNTTAGRVEMAEQMMQMGVIKTPEQYFTVINTGKLEAMTEDTQSELFLIKSENEKLVSGEEVISVATDQHSLHIKEHKCVLADPDLRLDPDLVERTLSHIQEHINALRTLDPDLLAMMGEQPLGPQGGSPAAQPDPNQQMNQTQMPSGNPDMLQPPPIAQNDQAASLGINVPAPATPPAPFDNLPTNPAEMLPQ